VAAEAVAAAAVSASVEVLKLDQWPAAGRMLGAYTIFWPSWVQK